VHRCDSETGLRRFHWFPGHDTRTLGVASEQPAALCDIQPRAAGSAKRDAGDGCGIEFGLVQNVRAPARLLAHLNPHGTGRPHVAKRVDGETADAAEESFFRHFQTLERLAVDERSICRDLKRPLIAIHAVADEEHRLIGCESDCGRPHDLAAVIGDASLTLRVDGADGLLRRIDKIDSSASGEHEIIGPDVSGDDLLVARGAVRHKAPAGGL
jgi:hypothetical protein